MYSTYHTCMVIVVGTVEPLYKGHFGTLILILITEVSSIQGSLDTLQYYTVTQNGILIIEVSTFKKFVIEGSHYIGIRLYIAIVQHVQ